MAAPLVPGANDFERIESAFSGAAALDAAARAALLTAVFSDRSDLREEVEALLAAHDRLLPVDEDVTRAAPGVGSRMGPFTLVEKLGEGGMGEVYRGERVDGGFEQHVAIKITRASLHHEDVVRRFRVERQILASLNHPNIVTMLDGGATADGQAYFVMEYVSGTTITRACRDREMPLDQRLALMHTICAAVQYAHQRGIVHRDLKPANILVQADGVPKVLDFGLAKLLNAPRDGETTLTGLLPGPLTPNYASPEQVRGLPVTTACDVYALGVLLYEVVAGVRPYETHGQPLDRIVEIVLHDEPTRPSAVTSDAPLPYPRSQLRGDVDAIVAKAMHKEPSERYDSAGELARDLTRTLNHEPVLARPLSASYVLRRMAARHKGVVTIGALALVAVLATSAAAFWQREVARREQARAETLFRDVRQLANALIFKVHDAVVTLPGSTEVRRTIVNDAVAYLERLEAQSGGDVTLRLELAAAYLQIAGILGDPQKPNLGDREGALRQYERARAIAAPLLTPNAPFEAVDRFAVASQQLSTLYGLKGDREKAVATARQAVDQAERYLSRHPGDEGAARSVAVSNFFLAWALPNQESIPVWERVLAHYDAQLARQPDSVQVKRNVALTSKYLAGVLDTVDRRPEALKYHRRAMELDESRLAAMPNDRMTQLDAAISYTALAIAIEFVDQDFARAADLVERSIALRRRVVEADPKDVQAQERLVYGLTLLAQYQRRRGERGQARSLLEEGIRIQDAVLRLTGDLSGRRQLGFAWYLMGWLEQDESHHDASCAAMQRAERNFSEAAEYLSPIQQGQLAEAKDHVAKCR